MMRTDKHNNPTAFTTDIAREARLVLGAEYTQGDPFLAADKTYYTAHLTGNPIEITIKVIDRLTFYTPSGHPRWTYIAIPKFIWDGLSTIDKVQVIKFMYQNEGGTLLLPLFNPAVAINVQISDTMKMGDKLR